MGFWGPPFTPPPDKAGSRSASALPNDQQTARAVDPVVYPINVPSEPSRAAYAAKYPTGMEAPYQILHSSFVLPGTSSASGDDHIVENSNMAQGYSSAQANVFLLVTVSLVCGIVIGVVLAPVLPSLRGNNQYSRIN